MRSVSIHSTFADNFDRKSRSKSSTAKAKPKVPVVQKDDEEDSDAFIAVGGEEALEGNAVASGSGFVVSREEEFGTLVDVRAEELAVGMSLLDGGREVAGAGRGGTRAASAARNPAVATAALPRRTNLRARVQRSTVQRGGSGEVVGADPDEEDGYFDELAQSDEEDDYDEYLDGENATGNVWHGDLPIRRPSASNRLVQQSTSSHSSTSAGPVLLLLPVASPLAGAAGANGTSATRTEVHPIPHPSTRDITDETDTALPISDLPSILPSAVPLDSRVDSLQTSIQTPTSSGSARGGAGTTAGRRRTNGRAASAAMAANNIINDEFFKTFIESDPIEEPAVPVTDETASQLPGLATAGSEGVRQGEEGMEVKVVSAEETAISTLIGGFGEQK